MMTSQLTDPRVEKVTALAEELGLQLRRADHRPGGWHIVDPSIDGKLYAFAFTKPHTFSLDEAEKVLLRRLADGAGDPDNLDQG